MSWLPRLSRAVRDVSSELVDLGVCSAPMPVAQVPRLICQKRTCIVGDDLSGIMGVTADFHFTIGR
jgi:hypothetical protein